MELFTISCTTCHAALKVRSESAIGQILACPKCQSMVQVLPPADWKAASGAAIAVGAVASTTKAAVKSAAASPPAAPQLVASQSSVVLPMAATAAAAISAPPVITPDEIVPPAEPAGIELPLGRSGWSATRDIFSRKVVCWTAGVGAVLFVLGAATGYVMSRPAPAVTAVAVATEPQNPPPQEVPGEPADEPAPSAPLASTPKTVAKPKPKSEPKQSEPKSAATKVVPAATDEKVPEEPQPESIDETDTEAAVEPPPQPEPTPKVTAKTAKKVPLDELLPQDYIPEAGTTNPKGTLPDSANAEAPAIADNAPVEPAEIGPSAASRRYSRHDATTTRPDAKSQLAIVLPQIDMREVPLANFVDFLSDLTSLPIALDRDALATARVTPQTRVTVSRHNAKISDALSMALAPLKLTYAVDDARITITTPAAAEGMLQSVKYRVDDLVKGHPESLKALSALLESMVAPTSWQHAGGKGTIAIEASDLVIKQTPPVHLRLIEFCEKLRQARGLPLRSKLPPERFELATRTAQAARRLEQNVTCTYLSPTRLVEVMRYFERTTGMTILIDWTSLAQEDFTPDSEISCSVDEQPLHAALDLVLAPLELDWRILDRHTIEVFSHHDAQDKASCEFYPLASLVEKGGDGEAIAADLHRATAPQLWRDSGGSGVWYFDSASTCLIVLQADSVQAEIQALLAEVQQKLSTAGR